VSAVTLPRHLPPPAPAGDQLILALDDLPLPALQMDGSAVVAVNRRAEDLLEVLLGNAALRAVLADPAGPPSVRVAIGDDARVLQVFRPVVAGRAVVLLHDVTAERGLVAALTESRGRLNDLVNCSADFAWETDAGGGFVYVSPKGALGRLAREVSGHPVMHFLCNWQPDAASPFETRGPCEGVEVNLMLGAGTIGIFEVSAVPRYDELGIWQGARGVCRDVTEARRQAEALREAGERLMEMARTDPLTGVLNRRAFFEELSVRLAQARRHGDRGLLLYLDLDAFKLINDGYGHAAGDRVLRLVAEVLQDKVRATDLVGRIGGDEFVVWLDRIGAVDQGRRIDALKAAIREAARDYPAVADRFGASIGAVGADGTVDPEELIVAADAAMYGAKRARRQ
jgi:diguanylate cyclase (GGDEF)-like protein